jgi:hypothetical protein
MRAQMGEGGHAELCAAILTVVSFQGFNRLLVETVWACPECRSSSRPSVGQGRQA